MMNPIIQNSVIDLGGWRIDDYFAVYPEGARDKKSFFANDDCPYDFIKPQRRYMLKRSRRMYPDQFWTEVISYIIGCHLGVEVPPAFAAYDPSEGFCGSLIEWFYEDNTVVYVPGGDYMQLAIDDYDRRLGTQHNLHTINVIGRYFKAKANLQTDIELFWAETILFDALIGNTDRHQDNWGILFFPDSKGAIASKFSPIFDNGTSLGHERFPEFVLGWTNKELDKYISKGFHHMRYDNQKYTKLNHIDFVKALIQANSDIKHHLQSKITNFDLDILGQTLDTLGQLQLPVGLSGQRIEWIHKLVSRRHQLLAEALN